MTNREAEPKHASNCQSHYADVRTGERLSCTCLVRNEPFCNLCGLSCVLGAGTGGADKYGLINATVSGGYFSTAGNGEGALDDGDLYTFSLCEFCLDWLFARFQRPVVIRSPCGEEVDPWLPARKRVARDDWRQDKEGFAMRVACRDAAREQLPSPPSDDKQEKK